MKRKKFYFVIGWGIRPNVIDDANECFWRVDSLSLSVPEQLADGLRRINNIIEI